VGGESHHLPDEPVEGGDPTSGLRAAEHARPSAAAAADVERGKVGERASALVAVRKQPYASARRVFWIVDNGSSHRGQKAVDRLERRWPNLVLVHLPVHASWLNQIEIFYSIVQRKLLEPNHFADLAELARTLNAFEHRWNEIAEPFDWRFTRDDLAAPITRLAAHEPQLQLAGAQARAV
jgi:transposase